MNRLPLTCISCKKPLSGGLDTYSELGQEMCWDCYSSFMETIADFDGLRLCTRCRDRYVSAPATVCDACRQQEAIDENF